MTEFRYFLVCEYVIVRVFTINSRQGNVAFVGGWIVRILSLCFINPNNSALPVSLTNGVMMPFARRSPNVVAILRRWCQTGARHVPRGTHVSTARLASAVAVLGSSSWWPIKLSLHSVDWPRHGIQADWARGGELDKQCPLTSTAPSYKFHSAPSDLGLAFLRYFASVGLQEGDRKDWQGKCFS